MNAETPGMQMDPISRFSGKAADYALYRWDYSNRAIDAIFEISKLTPDAIVADIGAGTGMLSKHFVGRVQTLFAIEPNIQMGKLGEESLASYTTYVPIIAPAESTTLPALSLDLIVVGRAIHWFNSTEARMEFMRIIKPGGWLAILQVPCADAALDQAIRSIRTAENGWDIHGDKSNRKTVPLKHYFGNDNYQTLHFPGTVIEKWSEFLGRLSSYSSAPDTSDEKYFLYEQAAWRIFKKFSVNGELSIRIATDLHIGQIFVT